MMLAEWLQCCTASLSESAVVQTVATIAHACGGLRHHPGDAVLAAFEDHAQQCCSDYTCPDWSALMQAFTRLHARPHRMYPLLLQQVCKNLLQLLIQVTYR